MRSVGSRRYVASSTLARAAWNERVARTRRSLASAVAPPMNTANTTAAAVRRANAGIRDQSRGRRIGSLLGQVDVENLAGPYHDASRRKRTGEPETRR